MKWEMEVLSPISYPSNMNSWFMEESKYTKWTPAENKMFENALAEHDKDTPDRWHKVAAVIPGKTVGDVMKHYRELEVDVSKIEAGLIPISGYGNGCNTSPFTLEWDNGHGHDGFRYGIGGKRSSSTRPPEQERKKGVPWTEEEHKLFLMGLKRYGKGDWRSISRNFVITRTPTQVASHAQKYFIRQLSGGKDKRRASIHDITTVNLNETTRTPSPDNKRPPSPPSPDPRSAAVLTQQQHHHQTPVTLSRTAPPFLWNQPNSGGTTMTFGATANANMFMPSPYGASSYGLKVQGLQNVHRGPARHGMFIGQQNLDFPLQSMHHYSHG